MTQHYDQREALLAANPNAFSRVRGGVSAALHTHGTPVPMAAFNWVSVGDGLPELLPIGNPPHEFVARSEAVVVCGWADREFIVTTADLRRGGRGLNDREAHWWNTRDAAFWSRDHLITHWAPLLSICPKALKRERA